STRFRIRRAGSSIVPVVGSGVRSPNVYRPSSMPPRCRTRRRPATRAAVGGGTVVGMAELEATRIDRWLWAVRLYKTRAAATAACKGGHVKLRGGNAKPAALVRVGDRVEARVGD